MYFLIGTISIVYSSEILNMMSQSHDLALIDTSLQLKLIAYEIAVVVVVVLIVHVIVSMWIVSYLRWIN